MTLEGEFSKLNKTKHQADAARQASDAYRENHLEGVDHYYQLLGELNDTQDSERQEQIIEELAGMDGINDADIPQRG